MQPAIDPAVRRARDAVAVADGADELDLRDSEARRRPHRGLGEVADGAQIVLVGAPGEGATADELLSGLRHPEAVTSLIGKLPLADLPALLARASLFLGNDSGPKHIAAGLGVPTVGIHSGTVDVREWGPIGPNAVAVAREMVCSPCYLSNPEDCRRGLACLRQLLPETVYNACQRLLLLSAPAQPTKTVARQPARPARRAVRAARQSAAALAAANPR